MGLELDQATGVRAHDEVGIRRDDVGGLLSAEAGGQLGLGQVIDTGAPAAAIGIGHLD